MVAVTVDAARADRSAAPAVAADDRLRAPQPHAQHRHHVGGRPIGEELTEALRIAHDELGVAAVRAHAILGDDLGTYREVDGQPVHDFSRHRPGLRPAAGDRAAAGRRAGLHAPRPGPRPADHTSLLLQGRVVAAEGLGPLGRAGPRPRPSTWSTATGANEVRDHWAFEVWNEPNLEYFWSGDAEEYLRLYDTAARAVRSVDAGLRVGGPSTAAVGWVEDLLAHTEKTGRAPGLRHHPPVRQPAAGPAPGPGPPRPRGRGRLVDRVGGPPAAVQPGGRVGVRGRVPGQEGCARPPAGSTPCPGGSPPTTSRSWAGRRRCSTAGSGC